MDMLGQKGLLMLHVYILAASGRFIRRNELSEENVYITKIHTKRSKRKKQSWKSKEKKKA